MNDSTAWSTSTLFLKNELTLTIREKFLVHQIVMGFKYFILVVLALCNLELIRGEYNELLDDIRPWPERNVIINAKDEEIHSNIFRNQDPRDPLLFVDKIPLTSRLINKYNTYYTPEVFEGEDEWVSHRCPPGQYITHFHVTNPNTVYWNGLRIYKIVFNCTNLKTGETSVLDMYEPLQYEQSFGLTVGPMNNFDKNRTCGDGYFGSIAITYHVQCTRRFLVEAWTIQMRCKDTWLTVTHGYGYDNWPPVSELVCANSACVRCSKGRALCGADVKIVHEARGTIEGFFFKFACCKILDSS